MSLNLLENILKHFSLVLIHSLSSNGVPWKGLNTWYILPLTININTFLTFYNLLLHPSLINPQREENSSFFWQYIWKFLFVPVTLCVIPGSLFPAGCQGHSWYSTWFQVNPFSISSNTIKKNTSEQTGPDTILCWHHLYSYLGSDSVQKSQSRLEKCLAPLKSSINPGNPCGNRHATRAIDITQSL